MCNTKCSKPHSVCMNDRRKAYDPYFIIILVAPMRGRGYNRGLNTRNDAFRLRPSNTSRPPSLHVDDFVAMETSSSSTYGKVEVLTVFVFIFSSFHAIIFCFFSFYMFILTKCSRYPSLFSCFLLVMPLLRFMLLLSF